MAGIDDLLTDLDAFTRKVLGQNTRELERLIDEELVAAWRRAPKVPVRTGALRDALTQRTNRARTVDLRVQRERVMVHIKVVHPRPDLVPRIDLVRAVQRAWTRYMEAPR